MRSSGTRPPRFRQDQLGRQCWSATLHWTAIASVAGRRVRAALANALRCPGNYRLTPESIDQLLNQHFWLSRLSGKRKKLSFRGGRNLKRKSLQMQFSVYDLECASAADAVILRQPYGMQIAYWQANFCPPFPDRPRTVGFFQ